MDEFLTLPRLNAIQKHWSKFPPIHVTAAVHFPLKVVGEKPRKIENAWQGADTLGEERFRLLVKQDVPTQNMRLP